MAPDPKAIARDRLIAEVKEWPGIAIDTRADETVTFRHGRGEIGHVDARGVLDVAFPKPLGDTLVASGKAHPHPDLPRSGWVRTEIAGEDDVERAIELLRHAHAVREEAAAERRSRASLREEGDAALEDMTDEASAESFPASDPPAAGRRD